MSALAIVMRGGARSLIFLSAFFTWFIPAHAGATALCVRISNDRGAQRSVPVRPGSALRLSFRHSIYGSQVEELFLLRPNGFELTQLRYGEARLVEFYGYDKAYQVNGVWVVTPVPTLLSSLNLTLSGDAAMALRFDTMPAVQPLLIHSGGVYRATVGPCRGQRDD